MINNQMQHFYLNNMPMDMPIYNNQFRIAFMNALRHHRIKWQWIKSDENRGPMGYYRFFPFSVGQVVSLGSDASFYAQQMEAKRKTRL